MVQMKQSPVKLGQIQNQIFKTAALKPALILLAVTGCVSVPVTSPQPPMPEQSAEAKPSAQDKPPVQEPMLPSHVGQNQAPTNHQAAAQGLQIASMRIEINELKEKMLSLQRKLELIMKTQRSGLFEAENLDQIRTAVVKTGTKKISVPPLESAGPLDRFEYENSSASDAAHDKVLSPENPQKIVDSAIYFLAQGEYARVAQTLENFQGRFPNHPLINTAELALAEAYVELKSPQQALPHIRTFYLQHPNDTLLYRAKWLEARVQEQIEAPQKASQLYREVIALSPQSDLALKSRAALEKMNRSTPQ